MQTGLHAKGFISSIKTIKYFITYKGGGGRMGHFLKPKVKSA